MTAASFPTPAQIGLMIRLDDGYPYRDSVGVEINELTVDQLRACLELHAKDLVAAEVGWRGTFWLRLTQAGRETHRAARTSLSPDVLNLSPDATDERP